MFKNLTLAHKIRGGFGILIALIFILGIIAVSSMWKVKSGANKLADDYSPEVQLASAVSEDASRVILEFRSYGLSLNNSYYDKGMKNFETFDNALKDLEKLSQERSELEKLKATLPTITENTDIYKKLVQETKNNVDAIEKARASMDASAQEFLTACEEYLKGQEESLKSEMSSKGNVSERIIKIKLINEVIKFGNEIRVANWKGQANRDGAILQKGLDLFPRINSNLQQIKSLTKQDINLQRLEKIKNNADNYSAAMKSLTVGIQDLNTLAEKRTSAANKVIDAASELSNVAIKNTNDIAQSASTTLSVSTTVVIIGVLVALVLGLFLGITISHSITQSLTNVMDKLKRGATQVASASTELSAASQQTAQGANEQASSLEETSASLEEMAAMTKQNTAHAQEVNRIAAYARENAEKATVSMKNMMERMSQIKANSDQTVTIVKSIDDIAFQTNILALNAAVEAARAGDAGRGFAVVADEVRNLAQRSAEAVIHTTSLIEQAKTSAESGVTLTNDVAHQLDEVFKAAQQVVQLIQEVTAASLEQSQGIQQINTAMSQLDQVTQNNASISEEAASSSENLAEQSQELMNAVRDLHHLVYAKDDIETQSSIRPIKARSARITHSSKTTEHFSSAPKDFQKRIQGLDDDDLANY